MAELASRVSGMVAGSMRSAWASHSAATASASARVGSSELLLGRRAHRLAIEEEAERPFPSPLVGEG